MNELGEQRPADITVLDMEASIEHFTRGTVRNLDVALLLAEPYYRSLETLGRMVPLAQQLGIPHILAIANKVRSPRDEAAITEYAQRHAVELVGVVPFDEAVLEADNLGRSLIDFDPHSPAVLALREIAGRIEARSAAAAPAAPR
jgi:CO dehydrogenase maturation factor